MIDEDAKIAGFASEIGPPNGLKQLSMRDCLSCLCKEKLQQLQFFRSQPVIAMLGYDTPAFKIDLEFFKDDGLGLFRMAVGSAKDCLDAGHEFLDIERLGDVVVGARIKCLYFIGLLVSYRYDDDRGIAKFPELWQIWRPSIPGRFISRRIKCGFSL